MAEPHYESPDSLRFSTTTGGGFVLFWAFGFIWFGPLLFFCVVGPAGTFCTVAPFLLLGLLPVWLGVRTWRNHARFGGAELELVEARPPARRLEGVVHLPHPLPEDAYIRLTLVCQRRAESSDGVDRVVWRTQDFVTPPPSEGGGRIPVAIDLPSLAFIPDTSSRYCRLNVYGEKGVRGLDVAFELPVSVVVRDQ